MEEKHDNLFKDDIYPSKDNCKDVDKEINDNYFMNI